MCGQEWLAIERLGSKKARGRVAEEGKESLDLDSGLVIPLREEMVLCKYADHPARKNRGLLGLRVEERRGHRL